MKTRALRQWVFGTISAIGVFGLGTSAQASEVGARTTAATAVQSDNTASVQSVEKARENNPSTPGARRYSPGIEEILTMVQAGISKEVIKTYIDNSPLAYRLTAADLIALKEHGVTDDLMTALIKRGSELRAQTAKLRADAGPQSAQRPYLDPESYEYFSYYYLYPRTLASANQRLFSSTIPLSDYSYTFYYRPLPFPPLPPSAFRRP